MPHPTDEALREIEATLTTQNHRIAAFVEAFSELPPDVRINVDATILDAIEAATSVSPIHPSSESHTHRSLNSIGLRA